MKVLVLESHVFLWKSLVFKDIITYCHKRLHFVRVPLSSLGYPHTFTVVYCLGKIVWWSSESIFQGGFLHKKRSFCA